jgi:hypothetical protein
MKKPAKPAKAIKKSKPQGKDTLSFLGIPMGKASKKK